MEKYTIPANTLKVGDSITFDQTKDQYIKITIMEKQISAVDFLLSELNNHLNMPHKHYEEISNQAKELFKQQIIDAKESDDELESGKDYYLKTFNQ